MRASAKNTTMRTEFDPTSITATRCVRDEPPNNPDIDLNIRAPAIRPLPRMASDAPARSIRFVARRFIYLGSFRIAMKNLPQGCDLC